MEQLLQQNTPKRRKYAIVRLDIDVLQRLREVSAKERRSQKTIVDTALMEYFEKRA